jgi:hypothetical protein
MSQKVFGIFPKSGEKMLQDALGQFKGIIAQIKKGVDKVKSKVSANTKKVDKLQDESDKLAGAMTEALTVMANLEAMLSGKVVTVQDNAEEEAVEEDNTEDSSSDESDG